jgi:hypothetical protein
MIKLVLALSVLFLGINIIDNSYAQTFIPFPKSDPSLPEITMQVIARNSDGQLIAYFEPTLWYFADLPGVHKLLDTKEKISIQKQGQQLEEFQFEQKYYFSKNNSGQITSEPLFFDNHEVLSPRHDGILMNPGDTLSVHWKFLRVI